MVNLNIVALSRLDHFFAVLREDSALHHSGRGCTRRRHLVDRQLCGRTQATDGLSADQGVKVVVVTWAEDFFGDCEVVLIRSSSTFAVPVTGYELEGEVGRRLLRAFF